MTWIIGAMWFSVLWIGLAGAQIYKWTDSQGNVHITDNPSQVPPQYRPNVEVKEASPPADRTASPPAREVQPASPPKDRLGRGPEYWQKQVVEWSTKERERALEYDRLQGLYNQTEALYQRTRDRRERGRIQAELERLKKELAAAEGQLKEAREMIHTTLPAEARRAGANPDWLQ